MARSPECGSVRLRHRAADEQACPRRCPPVRGPAPAPAGPAAAARAAAPPHDLRPTRRWNRLVSPAGPVARTGLQRRRNRTMAAMAVAAVAGVGLSLWGTSAWCATAPPGEYVEPAIGPDEPGYQAYVVATPTLAVFGADDDGDLARVALLSLRSGDDGAR